MGGIAIVAGAVVGYVVAHLREPGRSSPGRACSSMAAIVGAGLVGLRRRLDQGQPASATSASTSGPRSLGLLVVAVALRRARRCHLHRRRTPTLSFTRFDSLDLDLGRRRLGRCSARAADRRRRTNAVNLTDGLDGLAAGSSIVLLRRLHRHRLLGRSATPTCTRSRRPSTWPSSPAAMLGACTGFLWWNAAPGADLHGRHRVARHRRRAGRPRADDQHRTCCCRSSAASS